MTEKQLICQLKKLRDIQPKKDWVVFTKGKIFEENNIGKEKSIVSLFSTIIKELQIGEKFIFQHKLAFASVLIVVVFFGLFGFVQNSMPGDSLFALKRMTEQGQAVFISDNYKSIHNFEIADKRLDDLTKIAQSNDVDNLAPAITEYNETVSKAAQTLNQAGNVQEIALEIKKLQQKEEIIRSYGIEIGENEDLNKAIIQSVENNLDDYIVYLQEASLSDNDREVFEEAKKDHEEGNLIEARDKILQIINY